MKLKEICSLAKSELSPDPDKQPSNLSRDSLAFYKTKIQILLETFLCICRVEKGKEIFLSTLENAQNKGYLEFGELVQFLLGSVVDAEIWMKMLSILVSFQNGGVERVDSLVYTSQVIGVCEGLMGRIEEISCERERLDDFEVLFAALPFSV